MKKTICELFAGVGGFRLGFEKLQSGWETVWFSQYEPSKKSQWAHRCYVEHFGDSPDLYNNFTTNKDIAEVDKNAIPEHTLLVGGFPCQDYSVAQGLNTSKGIEGKKGVLWWQIRNVLIAKQAPFCLFENVDRLLKSPANQRGRDFGVMLACLNELGYNVEWRVVNAAVYGAAQRRRRVFIFAYHNSTKYAQRLKNEASEAIIEENGLMVKAFPIKAHTAFKSINIPTDILEASNNFKFDFLNSGCMIDGKVVTCKITELEDKPILLGEILEENVKEDYYITEEKLPKWEYLKGGKKIERTAKNGHRYIYSEGPVGFPDALDKPGRTMLTSEGTINRSSHAIKDKTGRIRIITPIEAERLQGFDDDWTKIMPEKMRYFCMGNALVVPMITRMGKILDDIISKEE